MNDELYNMIFKRESFHLFRNIGNEHITDEEIKEFERNLYVEKNVDNEKNLTATYKMN